jgi:hypothetical protein
VLTALIVFAALLAAPPDPTTAPALRGAPAAQELAAQLAADTPCSIRSNAGNCYAAGEYCRYRDLNKTTTDADGQTITCIMESGRPHWHHSVA